MARRYNRPKKLKPERDLHGLFKLESSGKRVIIESGPSGKKYGPYVQTYNREAYVEVNSISNPLNSHLVAAGYLRHNADEVATRVGKAVYDRPGGHAFSSIYKPTERARTAYKAARHFHRPEITHKYHEAGGKGEAALVRDLLEDFSANLGLKRDRIPEIMHRYSKAVLNDDDLASIKFALEVLNELNPLTPDDEEPEGCSQGKKPEGDSPDSEDQPKGKGGNEDQPEGATEPSTSGNGELDGPSGGPPSISPSTAPPDKPVNENKNIKISKYISLDDLLKQADIKTDSKGKATNIRVTDATSDNTLEDEQLRKKQAEEGNEYDDHTYITDEVKQIKGELDQRVLTTMSDYTDTYGRTLKRRGRPTAKAWRLSLGDTKVFVDPPVTKGDLIVMVDFSQSMGNWLYDKDSPGYLACQVMLAIAARHPDVKCYGFTSPNNRQRNQMDEHKTEWNANTGTHEVNLLEGGRGWPSTSTQIVQIAAGNVPVSAGLSGMTPMCGALNALEDLLRVKHAGSAAVFITDGDPTPIYWYKSTSELGGFSQQDSKGNRRCSGDGHTAAIAQKMHEAGTRFGVVEIGLGAPNSSRLFPNEARQRITNINDLPKIRQVLDWLDTIR